MYNLDSKIRLSNYILDFTGVGEIRDSSRNPSVKIVGVKGQIDEVVRAVGNCSLSTDSGMIVDLEDGSSALALKGFRKDELVVPSDSKQTGIGAAHRCYVFEFHIQDKVGELIPLFVNYNLVFRVRVPI